MRLLAGPAFVGFAFSLVAHLVSLFDPTLAFSAFFCLQAGALSLSLPMIFSAGRVKHQQKGRYWLNYLAPMRPTEKIAATLFKYYIIANIFLCLFSGPLGTGNFSIMRLISGHWMFFYLFPALYYQHYPDYRRPAGSSSTRR